MESQETIEPLYKNPEPTISFHYFRVPDQVLATARPFLQAGTTELELAVEALLPAYVGHFGLRVATVYPGENGEDWIVVVARHLAAKDQI